MIRWFAVLAVCFSLGVVAYASSYSIHRELKRMSGYTILGTCTIDKITDFGARERFVSCTGGSVFKLEPLALVLAMPASDVIVFGRISRSGTVEAYRLLFESDDMLNAARIR